MTRTLRDCLVPTVATGGYIGGIGQAPPIQPPQVGSDEQGAVGPYKAPFTYGGKIVKVRLQLGD